MSKKLPAMPFYIGDWKKDPIVQMMDAEDEGIYLRILMIMWETDPRGYLTISGNPIDTETLSRMTNLDNQKLSKWLTSYQNKYSIFGESPDGILFSRKQVKIAELSEIRKTVGKQGGNPNLLNQKESNGLTKKADGGYPKHEDEDEALNESIIKGECEGEIKKDAFYLVRNIWGKNPVGLDISSTNKLIDHFGFPECEIVFRISHKNGAKRFSYVEKVLKNRVKEQKSKEMEEAAKKSESDHGIVKAEDKKKYDFSKDTTFQALIHKVDNKKSTNGREKTDLPKEKIKPPTVKEIDESDPDYQKAKSEFENELKEEK